MIPKSPERPDLVEIQRHFDLAMEEAARVLRELPRKRRAWPLFRKSAVPPATMDEIGWTIHNARGMALMYYTDHLPASGEDWNARRIATLREAIGELDRADRISPRNWANHCDMASARMRLGYYEQSPAMFSQAFSLLELVIDRLRPGYGFAIYEMGRIDRLRHDFESAAGRFERILAMPKEERLDIDDGRLEIELARARAGDPSFP
jgi:tetratricopeptide (TPR) repeat protein